jgi:predicted nucleotidyltransferase
LAQGLTDVTKKGTIVPEMGTTIENDSLVLALFGKTRRAILSLLFTHTDEAFYLRQILRLARVGAGSAQREVKGLAEAGIITRTRRGNLVYYQANPACPIFAELKSLMIKTAGVGDLLRSALAPLGDRVRLAFVYGSFASGHEKRSSDIDVMVVGEVSFREVISALEQAQQRLAREVNPSVYPPTEFRKKLAANSHFVKSVLKGPKIFLIGDHRELARVAKKRLVD